MFGTGLEQEAVQRPPPAAGAAGDMSPQAAALAEQTNEPR